MYEDMRDFYVMRMTNAQKILKQAILEADWARDMIALSSKALEEHDEATVLREKKSREEEKG